MAGKQAKIISNKELNQFLDAVKKTRYPERNELIVLLSYKAGLRAKEISCLTWSMVTDASGIVNDYLQLTDRASKGRSGRIIPLHKHLKEALIKFVPFSLIDPSIDYVIKSERGHKMTPGGICEWFKKMYVMLRLDGCSSHSGRRTFCTSVYQKIGSAGGNIVEVSELMGHSSLSMTRRYIESRPEAKRKVIDLI